MMKLRINPLVVTDLKEIRRFIAEDNREKTECGHLLSVLIRKTEGIGKIVSHFFCFFAITRLCHFIENESPRNVVFISISGRFALK